MRPTINTLLALVLAVMPTQLSAQTMECTANGCRVVYQSAPRATVFRPAPVRTRATRVRTYRRGPFGRMRPVDRYVPASASYQSSSYGSAGSAPVYSSGSHGGYRSAPAAKESYGSSGGYGASKPAAKAQPPATLPPADDQASALACPCGDGCRCGPDCDCRPVVVARLPPLPVIAALPAATAIASLPKPTAPTLIAMR